MFYSFFFDEPKKKGAYRKLLPFISSKVSKVSLVLLEEVFDNKLLVFNLVFGSCNDTVPTLWFKSELSATVKSSTFSRRNSPFFFFTGIEFDIPRIRGFRFLRNV